MRKDTPAPTPTPTPIAVLLVLLCVVVEFTDGNVAAGTSEGFAVDVPEDEDEGAAALDVEEEAAAVLAAVPKTVNVVAGPFSCTANFPVLQSHESSPAQQYQSCPGVSHFIRGSVVALSGALLEPILFCGYQVRGVGTPHFVENKSQDKPGSSR